MEIPYDGVESAGNHCSHVQNCAKRRPTTQIRLLPRSVPLSRLKGATPM